MGIRWEDPPAPRSKPPRPWRWVAEAAELREHPGRWARLTTDSANLRSAAAMAHNIRAGLLRAFQPAGAFEAVARGDEVWVRYVGHDEEGRRR